MINETEWIVNKSHKIEVSISWSEQPKFACVVMHGMAEHNGRYHDFVSHLVEAGGYVITYNHRGHGPHAERLGDIESMAALIDDANAVARLMPSTLPQIIIGHSMGAIVARNLMLEGNYQSYIIIGTMAKTGIFDWFSLQLLKPLALLFGQSKLKLINYLALGVNDKSFDGEDVNRWLSISADNVSSYNDDPLTGFKMSTFSIYESLKYLQLSVQKKRLKAVTNNPRILLVAGQDDALSRFGRDMHVLAKKYKTISDDVSVHLYPNARHEVLNEDNHLVFHHIERWIKHNE